MMYQQTDKGGLVYIYISRHFPGTKVTAQKQIKKRIKNKTKTEQNAKNKTTYTEYVF